MFTLLKKLATPVIVASTIIACTNHTSEMAFDGEINKINSSRIILTTKITNYSDTEKVLSEIDIDKSIHEILNLSRMDGSIGSPIPFDNTYSYEINRRIPPGEAITINFKGNSIRGFISGEIDFIINNDQFNFRSISIDCCK